MGQRERQIVACVFLIFLMWLYIEIDKQKPEVRYLFKPEPDEIHLNSDEKCYAWQFESPMGWKKLIRICERL